MSTKDVALRIVKDQFGQVAEEACRFVSNKGHPSFAEIVKDVKDVYGAKINDSKISECVLALSLHSILVPVIPSPEIKKIISARYTFNAKAALYRLRIGSYIQYVREELGDECASIATELAIRGAATIEDVVNSVLASDPGSSTSASLLRAADTLIMRNFVSQKTDIATYARVQNAEDNPNDISRHPPATRGRGRGRGRGRSSTRTSASSTLESSYPSEDDKKTSKRKAKSIGDQLLEMQAKKVKQDEAVQQLKDSAQIGSTLDEERKNMLFSLNIEQYTCIMRQQIIMRFVEEKLNPSTAKILQTIFALIGYSRDAHSTNSGVFSGQKVYSRIEESNSVTWSLFLKHMQALASDRVCCLTVVTPCESNLDAVGGEYQMNYEGVMEKIVEETVASFIDKRYNFICSSIFRALLKYKKLEEQQVATICMLPEKVCRTSIFALSNDRFIRTQEVPRKPDYSTQTTMYLFTVDMEYTVKTMIDFIYSIILNLRSRQKVIVMKHASLFEAQKRGNLSEQQKMQMNRMENGLRCMDMSILKMDQTLALLRDMY